MNDEMSAACFEQYRKWKELEDLLVSRFDENEIPNVLHAIMIWCGTHWGLDDNVIFSIVNTAREQFIDTIDDCS